MAADQTISVALAYALPERQQVETLSVPQGVTARELLKLADLPKGFPDIDIETCPIGVFGEVVADSYVMQAGDRLEIYRPLENDPRDTRRRLAAEGKTMGSGKRRN